MDDVLSKFSNIADGFHTQLKSSEDVKGHYAVYRRSIQNQLDDMREDIQFHGKKQSSALYVVTKK